MGFYVTSHTYLLKQINAADFEVANIDGIVKVLKGIHFAPFNLNFCASRVLFF